MDNTNNNNDIDALLDALVPTASGFGDCDICRADARRFHSALTALLAERDALKAECNKRFDSVTIKDLLAERDKLKQRVEELKRDVDMWREDAHKWKEMYNRHYESERIWISRCDELKQRVAELGTSVSKLAILNDQLLEQPPADRDLRERLVCAIWPQMLRSFDQPSDDGSRYEWQAIKAKARNEALDEADAMIAAMRKEGGGA